MPNTDLSDLTPEDPGSYNIPFSKGSSWGATTKALIQGSHSFLPLSGGTMTGPIRGGGAIWSPAADQAVLDSNGLWIYDSSTANACAFTCSSGTTAQIAGSGTVATLAISGMDVTLSAGKTVQYSDDVDWTNVTYSGTWADLGSGYQGYRYCKRQGVVYIEGAADSGTGDLFTLPVGCRPAADLLVSGVSNSTTNPARGRIGSDGVVTVFTFSTWFGLQTSFYAG